MREASGEITSDSYLVVFLYMLAEYKLPIGELETLLDRACGISGQAVFTNGWVAEWAKDAEKRLIK